jgi:hypothetical protein
VHNTFLAATAARQLIGLASARATAQSQALADAVEGMAAISLADPREAIGWMMQSGILLLRSGHYGPALAIIGWERRNRVTPVHPDQLNAIDLLMPAAVADLGDEVSQASTELLQSASLRAAIDYTSAALLEAWRTTSVVGAA